MGREKKGIQNYQLRRERKDGSLPSSSLAMFFVHLFVFVVVWFGFRRRHL